MAYKERRWILVSALYISNIGELQRAPCRNDWSIANLLKIIERAIQPDVNLLSLRVDGTGWRYRVLPDKGSKDVAGVDAQRGKTCI